MPRRSYPHSHRHSGLTRSDLVHSIIQNTSAAAAMTKVKQPPTQNSALASDSRAPPLALGGLLHRTLRTRNAVSPADTTAPHVNVQRTAVRSHHQGRRPFELSGMP